MGKNQVFHAAFPEFDGIVQERDADQALALACHFGRSGTGLLIVLYLFVQFRHIFQRVFFTTELEHGSQQRIAGA